jgi:cold shock CspA family protein
MTDKKINQNVEGGLRYGHILRYNPDKGIGTIFSDNERFFFHVDRIMKGKLTPAANDKVQFRVAIQQSSVVGRLPAAHAIEILDDVLEPAPIMTGELALAQPLEQPDEQNGSKAGV